jgi:Tfp pilus assembly protein PilF
MLRETLLAWARRELPRAGGLGRIRSMHTGSGWRPALIAGMATLLCVGSGCMQVVNSSRAQTDKAQVEQAMARRDLGLDHLKKGKNALALRELKFADELNPNDPETLLWLGEGYRRQGHNDTALD